ncbi:MAG: response regulator [Rhodocyclaceae bacterium]|nr:response regulator [Rhodocyclaceae bacterium]MDZ4216611.1 response regulator [Rhodocyclaceae bacterium]
MTQTASAPKRTGKPASNHADMARGLTPGLIAILVVGALMFASAVLFIEYRNAQRNEQKALEQIAEAYSNSILTFRDFYNQVILSKISGSGIEITHEYQSKAHAVPIPATLSLDLIQFLNSRQVNVSMRLVSEHPFPARQGRFLTDFDREATRHFQTTAQTSFSRMTEKQSRTIYEYAVPVRLSDNCVACHNSHPESPKRDWKIGDIRGIQVVTLLPEMFGNDNLNQRAPLIVAVLFFFAFTLAVIFWLVQRNQAAFRLLLREKKQLAEASAAAEAASRAKSDFLANMSHEIRTPMNGIIGMSDLSLDASSEDERQEYMKIVKSSAESLLGILNDILDFSKIEANKLMLERVGFELRQTVSETLKALGPRATQKGLELICDIADDVPQHVLGDPTRLRQVLINLIGNAVKFTDSGEIIASLAVEARTDTTATLQVAVRDSGIGISSDKLDSIFEAFAQADASTTRQYGGTGLGLSISSRLVELMGGHMSVDSELGTGSTFQFTLVLGVDDTPTTPLATEQLVDKQVLVVDDNAVNREIFLRQLTRWGMKAVAASSGAEAQALCGQQSYLPDLVLLDQHMPEMDGITLATWMREQPQLKTTPMLILSSGPLKDDAERARALQLRGYLTKPITDIDLLAAVKRALGLAEATVAPPRPAVSQAQSSADTLNVLLVEDNPINQQLAIRLLEKWGHKVTLAVHGQEAVNRMCGGECYDVVLMDMQMPVMGGIEATQLIRADEAEHGKTRVPIMAMTANAMQGDREACLDAGMNDYISKPITQHELANKLRQLTSTTSASRQITESPAVPEAGCAVLPAPTFDYAAAVAGMDAEIIEILAPAFLELHENELGGLRDAIANGDTEETMRRAHGLKGTLAAFGAQPAERRAAEMEVLTKAGQQGALPPLLAALEDEIGKLVAVLRR